MFEDHYITPVQCAIRIYYNKLVFLFVWEIQWRIQDFPGGRQHHGGSAYIHIIWHNFCRKRYEHEQKSTERFASPPPPPINQAEC